MLRKLLSKVGLVPLCWCSKAMAFPGKRIFIPRRTKMALRVAEERTVDLPRMRRATRAIMLEGTFNERNPVKGGGQDCS